MNIPTVAIEIDLELLIFLDDFKFIPISNLVFSVGLVVIKFSQTEFCKSKDNLMTIF